MSDLISREAFKRKLYEADCVDKYGFVNCGVTRINILLEQSAVDAVEVVRCKDCARRNDPGECPMCFLSEGDWDDYTSDDGYCDRGERREENADSIH